MTAPQTEKRAPVMNPFSPPLLAVVTVTLNDLPGLLATRASLRRQTSRDFEWLVADGGSRDGTAAWLDAHDAEISWRRSGPDLGIYDAMNRCLDRVTAQAVLFLNAGDTLADSNALSRIAEAVRRHPDAGFFYGDALQRRPDGAMALKPARSHRLAAFGMFTHHQAMIYRRSAVAGLRYDLAYPIGADYDFTLAVLRRGAPVVRLREPVCVYRDGGAARRHAQAGRNDQARIRLRRYPIATLWNGPLSSIQWATHTIRTLMPSIYATIRYRQIKP